MKIYVYIFDVSYGVDEFWTHIIYENSRELADKKMLEHLIKEQDMTEPEAKLYMALDNGGLNKVLELST